jgi:hypothetical protein
MVNVDMHDVVKIEVKSRVFTKEKSAAGHGFSIFEVVFTDKKGETLRVQGFSNGETAIWPTIYDDEE